jgi:hypothetical protein
MRTTTKETAAQRIPEARYAYYRRCQVFRKGGEQCKAPAEKGSHICYAHAGQLALALRRERERRVVLAEAVAEMRRQGKPDCEMADLFTDFKGTNVTLAVMARAIINGRIDCKTAGRLLVHLQTVSKLLWLVHRKGREGRKGSRVSPQICADECRLDKLGEKPNLTAEARRRGEEPSTEENWAASQCEEGRMALVIEVRALANRFGWAHAPPELLMAAA